MGRPPSGNGASSMHLHWVLPPSPPLVEVAATLEVVEPPAVAALYFWALQVSFVDAGGGHHGAAHLGLQWHPAHRDSTAANWGGYAPGGGELAGEGPNTRDYPWVPRRPYRLAVRPSATGGWSGFVDGDEVRRLRAGGDHLAAVIVWSEVFARCAAPPVAVRWSALEARTIGGDVVAADRVRVTYQSYADGGCDNTTARPTAEGVLQVTSTAREVPDRAVVPVSA